MFRHKQGSGAQRANQACELDGLTRVDGAVSPSERRFREWRPAFSGTEGRAVWLDEGSWKSRWDRF